VVDIAAQAGRPPTSEELINEAGEAAVRILRAREAELAKAAAAEKTKTPAIAGALWQALSGTRTLDPLRLPHSRVSVFLKRAHELESQSEHYVYAPAGAQRLGSPERSSDGPRETTDRGRDHNRPKSRSTARRALRPMFSDAGSGRPVPTNGTTETRRARSARTSASSSANPHPVASPPPQPCHYTLPITYAYDALARVTADDIGTWLDIRRQHHPRLMLGATTLRRRTA
jgi:hypothetical protein